MKKMILTLILLATGAFAAIEFEDSFEKAVKSHSQTQKPLLICFGQSENQFIFMENLQAKFLFVKGTRDIAQKIHLSESSSIVLYDAKWQKLVAFDLKDMNQNEIISMLQEYYLLLKGIQKIDGNSIETLYLQAKNLEAYPIADHLLQLGVDSHKPYFFLLEKYQIALKGDHVEEAGIWKKRIYEVDPHNKTEIVYKASVLEHEYLLKSKGPCDEALNPLTKYLQAYGKKDKRNRWKIYLIISQYYLSKGELEKALEYTRFAYKESPKNLREDVAESIHKLKNHLSMEKGN